MTDTKIRVEIKSQVGTSRDPAHVRIYQGDELLETIIATIEPEQGADSGFYNCVKLTKLQKE